MFFFSVKKPGPKELYEKFGAQAVEMEGGAITQVAEQFGIPAIVVRCLSDLAGANGHKLSSTSLTQTFLYIIEKSRKEFIRNCAVHFECFALIAADLQK